MFTYGNLKRIRDTDFSNPNNPTPIIPSLVKQIRHHSMDPWQTDVSNIIKTSQKSIIINVTPAAGKTWPVMDGLNYLFEKKSISKILFCVPIQFLAAKLTQDIKESVNSGLITSLISNPQQLKDIDLNFIDQYLNKFIGVKVASGTITDSPTKVLPSRDTKVDIATYEHAAKLITQFDYDIVIIDEFQESVPLRNDPDKYKKGETYGKIISNAKRLIILTGSLNRNSINRLAEYIKQYSSNIKDIEVLPKVSDLSNIKNRSKINILASPDVTNPQRLVDVLTNKIKNREPGNLLVIFSRVGMLKHYIDPLLNKKSLPNILNLNNIKSQQVSFNTKTIPQDKLYTSIADYEKNNSANRLLNNIQEINPLLKQCLEKGFGYIIGGSHVEKDGTQREINKILEISIPEKQLISDLFVNKKIYVAIATDSVGLGVTLDVQHLYIPSIKKFDGTKISTIDISSLIQILNRAGRGKFDIANIYCAPSDVEYISKIINNFDPVIDIAVADVEPLKDSMIKHNKNMGISDKLSEILFPTN